MLQHRNLYCVGIFSTSNEPFIFVSTGHSSAKMISWCFNVNPVPNLCAAVVLQSMITWVANFSRIKILLSFFVCLSVCLFNLLFISMFSVVWKIFYCSHLKVLCFFHLFFTTIFHHYVLFSLHHFFHTFLCLYHSYFYSIFHRSFSTFDFFFCLFIFS